MKEIAATRVKLMGEDALQWLHKQHAEAEARRSLFESETDLFPKTAWTFALMSIESAQMLRAEPIRQARRRLQAQVWR